MEDRHLFIPDLQSSLPLDSTINGGKWDPIAFCGVFDGHNGVTCAEFLENNFPIVLSKTNQLKPAAVSSPSSDCNALEECLRVLDKGFLSNSVTLTPPDFSGACVVSALIRRDHLSIAWLGDCRAVLCQNDGVAVQVTADHKPSRPDETARIVDAGGSVSNKRVNGVLAVSRSIGDVEYKDLKESSWGKVFKANLVVSEAETFSVSIKGHLFLLMASDGLFDVMSSQDAIDYIHSRLVMHGQVHKAASDLMEEIHSRKSEQDNITIIIVTFNL
jgi:protein phosphatase 2C family protein 2/3